MTMPNEGMERAVGGDPRIRNALTRPRRKNGRRVWRWSRPYAGVRIVAARVAQTAEPDPRSAAATQPDGAGNPKFEARNPKQIRIARNGAMGKRESATFLCRLRAISTIAVRCWDAACLEQKVGSKKTVDPQPAEPEKPGTS